MSMDSSVIRLSSPFRIAQSSLRAANRTTRPPQLPQLRRRFSCYWRGEKNCILYLITFCFRFFKFFLIGWKIIGFLSELEIFQVAESVKVDPDSPQKQVRFLTLSEVVNAEPRLRAGFFSVLQSSMLAPRSVDEACTSVGVAKYGRPIGLDEKIKVDLIVIGSVAVDPRTGFAEPEYGMLRYMGAIDDSTPVVTSVHDCQLVDDIPVEKLLIHDVPVDVICTPTQVIFTNTSIPKPQGIYWDKLSPEKLGQIRILRELERKIEQETGRQLPCGPSEKLPPTAQRSRSNSPVK
ncbi:hypothetical protein ACJRO7_007891 [Eucalyptus globulus]|uniref:5-formyltetrahydrofolate cyclo-ligase n=1 Tax=Eucalyptus globulus TaxID=34317 RepID=A0ABD3IPW0_EUCGL